MRRAASQLTPDISFEPDRWGTVAGAPLPHSEEMTTCALSTPDSVLRARSECLIVPPLTGQVPGGGEKKTHCLISSCLFFFFFLMCYGELEMI